MSEHVATLIAECEAKIGQLTDIVEKLRWFRREFPHTAASIVPVTEPTRRKYTKRAASEPAAPKITAAKAVRASRRLRDDDPITAKILEQLRKKSPMSPGDLTAAVREDTTLVRRRVRQLEQSGQITTTGSTTQRLVHLLVHLGTGKAAPDRVSSNTTKSADAVKPPAPSSSTLPEVEERDRHVLLRIRGAGPGGRSVRELTIVLGETEASIMSAIDRLRIKKQIQTDGNGKWVSA